MLDGLRSDSQATGAACGLLARRAQGDAELALSARHKGCTVVSGFLMLVMAGAAIADATSASLAQWPIMPLWQWSPAGLHSWNLAATVLASLLHQTSTGKPTESLSTSCVTSGSSAATAQVEHVPPVAACRRRTEGLTAAWPFGGSARVLRLTGRDQSLGEQAGGPSTRWQQEHEGRPASRLFQFGSCLEALGVVLVDVQTAGSSSYARLRRTALGGARAAARGWGRPCGATT